MYKKLRRQGYKPLIIEGWVEVEHPDLLPNEECLRRYFPDKLKLVEKDEQYNDYPRVAPHTWLILDGKVIDVTKNQFVFLGGIIKYFERCRYWFENSKEKEVFKDGTYYPEQRKEGEIK